MDPGELEDYLAGYGGERAVVPSVAPSSVSSPVETLQGEILAETVEKEEKEEEEKEEGEEEYSGETTPPSAYYDVNYLEDATTNTSLSSNFTTNATTTTTSEAYQQPDWWNSGIRTNFDYQVPFNFSYIFLIGGYCDGAQPDDWSSLFVAAGNATLGGVTDIICCHFKPDDDDNHPYSREFHLYALTQIEERVGDKLNETLVITAGIGMEEDWTPLVDLLKKGMALFYTREARFNLQLEDFGLVPEETLFLHVQWNDRNAAALAGQELCRVRRGVPSLKVAQVFADWVNGSFNYRTELALEAFQKACPETEVERVWSLSTEQRAAYRATLNFNPIPDVILLTTDVLAVDILEIAKDSLRPDQYEKISITGWDNHNPLAKFLLEEGKMLTTVDQGVHCPNQGIWHVIKTALESVQEAGLNSTWAMQQVLNLGSTSTLPSPATLLTSDPVGYILEPMMIGYQKAIPPSRNVQVSTGLLEVSITEMVPFEGKIESVLWLRSSWYDPRLTFNPNVGGDMVVETVPIDPELVWTPFLFFKNEFTHKVLYEAPTRVFHNGTVIMETNILLTTLCSTEENLESFPFDTYDCSIDLGAPMGICLDSSYGFVVIDSDPNFETTISIAKNEGCNPSSVNGDVIFYQMRFERKLFTAFVRLILPAVLINLVGFMTFWIPEKGDSIALGVTSLLCSLAFRETVDVPQTSDITWTEIFMMVQIGYQTTVLAIIWLSYSHSSAIKCWDWSQHFRKEKMTTPDNNNNNNNNSTQQQQKPDPADSYENHDMLLEANQKNSTTSTHSKSWQSTQAKPTPGGLSKSIENEASGSASTLLNEKFSLCSSESSESHGESDPSNTVVSKPPAVENNSRTCGESTAVSNQNTSQDPVKKEKVDEDKDEDEEDKHRNLDWIGRWIVVPSYVCIMLSLILHGWGFLSNSSTPYTL